MSARLDNVVTFPIVPRLPVSNPSWIFGSRSATVIILPTIRIERYCEPDGSPVRKRRARQSIVIK